MVNGIRDYIKKSMAAAKERRKLKENMAIVESKCHKAKGEFLRLMDLIDEAAPKAPDPRAASKLTCMRSRVEICLGRVAQIQEAIKEQDCIRMSVLNANLMTMRSLILNDAAELIREYAPHHAGFSRTAKEQ